MSTASISCLACATGDHPVVMQMSKGGIWRVDDDPSIDVTLNGRRALSRYKWHRAADDERPSRRRPHSERVEIAAKTPGSNSLLPSFPHLRGWLFVAILPPHLLPP